MPVSYTHLDVYKRQVRRLLGVEITDRLTCIKLKLRNRILLGNRLTPE